MKCVSCGKEIDEGSNFCGFCGKRQPSVKHCIKCGKEIGLDDVFCGYCGALQNVGKETAPVVNDERENQEELHKSKVGSIQDIEVVDTSHKVKATDMSSEEDLAVAEEQLHVKNITERKEGTIEEEAVEDATIKDKEENVSKQLLQEESNETGDKQNNTTKGVINVINALFVLLVIVLVAYVCYQVNSNSKSSEDVDYEQMDSVGVEEPTKEEPLIPFTTKRFSFKDEDELASTSVELDYPVGGEEQLIESIRKVMLKTLVNTFTWGEEESMPSYTGDVTDGQVVANFYGKEKMKRLREENRENDMHYQIIEDISFLLKCETEKIITYEISLGGCHGGGHIHSYTEGITFLKKNGKRLEIIKDPNDDGFKKLLINYVKKYADIDVNDLLSSFYDNPMPKSSPVFSLNGVTFNYYKGEIVSMMSGYPSVTIPFEEIKKYLTDEAKEIIGE